MSALSAHFRGESRTLAERLVEITFSMQDYWPLTVRQAYYQAVAALLIANNENQYKRVSRVLTDLRRQHFLPWHAFEDRTRRTIEKRGIADLREFVREQTETLFDWRYYHRCYVQNQDNYIEVATEKEALTRIMEDAVWEYCVRLSPVRGQVGAPMVKGMAERFTKARANGQRPILLYLGDLDPSGLAIPLSLVRVMAEHHGVDVYLARVALNADQVRAHRLPQDPDAAKPTDPNYQKWLVFCRREYPEGAPVEFDALHPRLLTEITQRALGDYLDLGEMSIQRQIERKEREQLKGMRREVLDYIGSRWPDLVGTSTNNADDGDLTD
jgi:hypothetical protein